jgi:hypothetical protein
MATETDSQTDMGIGLAVLFSVLAGVGALGMLVGAPELTAAWAFAGAVIFGSVAVVAIHVYWS